MADPYIAEIRMFAGNFAPSGWAFCNGQLLPIQQNTALFSLLGTTYGGNGQTTFGLPDLRDRSPIHFQQGPGLSDRSLGETGGAAAVALTPAEIPAHTHVAKAALSPTSNTPNANVSLSPSGGGAPVYKALSHPTAMAAQTLSATGSALPHNNMQPYLAVTFIIALQGVFPPRS